MSTAETMEGNNTMPADLSGRLHNTPLPYTSAMLPLYEAVVNAIHAIEEAKLSTTDGEITVSIQRETKAPELDLDGPKKRGPEPLENIVGFTVTDNGIGFNADNMRSFRTLDTRHKALIGGRGIGRLLWLKAFEKVTIESTYYADNGKLQTRAFDFTATSGIHNETSPENATINERKTVVRLQMFNKRYRRFARKTVQSIADNLLEHCLWYFIRDGGAPKIIVVDGTEQIDLDVVLKQHMHTGAVPDSFDLKGHHFELVHVRMHTNALSAHTTALCANNRLVLEEKINGKIPGLYGRITDQSGDFFYTCYVRSSFLDETVRPERTGFSLSDDIVEGLFEEQELSLNEIREAVLEKAKRHLSNHLSSNLERAKARVDGFVKNKAPRYSPILRRIPDEQLNIDPSISDKDLDLALHKHLYHFERELMQEGHDVMRLSPGESADQYKERLKVYLDKAADLKQSDLANYVSHRKVIIELFQMALQKDINGDYVYEELIHSLIVPMQKESRELAGEPNLWLLDERLAFHNYLASDKPIKSMPITGSQSAKEPDIIALNVFDNPIMVSEKNHPPMASLVVVEIKRPGKKNSGAGEEKDPIEQAIGYLRRIREGKVITTGGRPVPKSESIPGFIYVLAELTTAFNERCEYIHNLTRTSDGQGWFDFKKNINAYVEVISFDRLVNMAKQRNKAFFDRLGLPTN
jgi:hypothetical protein